MKQKLKYLGIGLFIAGLIFSLGERFKIPYIESSKNVSANAEIKRYEKEIASLNNAISTLEEEVQLLTDEVSASDDTTTVSTTESTDKTNNSNTESNSADKTNSSFNSSTSTSEIVTGTIYIYEFVSLYDIGKQAEDLNIIKNGRDLELFLAKPQYSRSIQKGVFELRSDMTLEKMAEILTGKK